MSGDVELERTGCHWREGQRIYWLPGHHWRHFLTLRLLATSNSTRVELPIFCRPVQFQDASVCDHRRQEIVTQLELQTWLRTTYMCKARRPAAPD